MIADQFGLFTYDLIEDRGTDRELLSDKRVVRITSCSPSAEREFVIPSEIEGKLVTKIGYEAFAGCNAITKITIPEGIVMVEWGAFSNCSALKIVTIPASVGYLESGGARTTALVTNEGKASREYYRVREVLPLDADFEDGAVGWATEVTAGETQWAVGLSETSSAGPDNHFLATNPGDRYTKNAEIRLHSPLVDLSLIRRAATLSFQYRIDASDVEGGQLRFVGENGGILSIVEKPFTGTTADWNWFEMLVPYELQDAKFSL